ncbi:MAG: protease modulator HflK [Verrucomicrobiae bacterium]|nr:protease modulator HflK [Verrucomicrobiae bacterium]
MNPTPTKPPAPGGWSDAGTQALAEALKSSFGLVRLALVVLVVYFCGSNFFTVSQNERAVLLRFGQPVGRGEEAVLGPGFHLAWPYPIDEVVKIPAQQILSASSTVGWPRELRGPAANTPPPRLNPVLDGYAVTGDGNIIHAQAQLRYRVVEPVRFYFGFTNAMALVTNALNNALFHAMAQFSVDDALRLNLPAVKERMLARVEQLAREQGLGIVVEQLDLVTVPPRQVKAAFDQVTAAESELHTKVNEAQAHANGVRARAQGEASARRNAAEAERNRLVAEVEAEARYFLDLLPSYRRDAALFTARLQVETLGRVLTNAQDKFFLPARADGRPRELRLQLNREPARLKTESPAPAAPEHKH